MSASGTQSDKDKNEEDHYLSRTVGAVDLPKMQRPDTTYPPLIIDGASGTGKTQQAFALVKEHKDIIYFLLSDEQLKEQKIYRRMRLLTNDKKKSRFAHRVDEAIKALRDSEDNKDKDICSVDFLRDTMDLANDEPVDYNPIRKRWARNAEIELNWLAPLVDVVLWMCSQRLQYVNGGLDVAAIELEGKTIAKFQELSSQLKHIIFFLDEALPQREFWSGDRPEAVAIDRLRFVRNLGRALTMRVVMAGTAATAANMIAVAAWPNPASRTDGSEDTAWIECQFMRRTMTYNDVKEVLPKLGTPDDVQPSPKGWRNDLIPELMESRPYLVHLFGRVMMNWLKDDDSDNLPLLLQKVGDEIKKEKNMSDASNLVYLMGPFLDRGHTSPCPFPVKPAALVRGHFFEPCAVVDSGGNPVFGLLMGKRSLASGDRRIKIYREYSKDDKRIMWCASLGIDDEPRTAALCWDFAGVEYSLSACVQQCLAREPLLAVALSTQCVMNKEAFGKALSKVCRDSIQQRAGDSTDGDLHELILFAVLQLASNCREPSEEIAQTGTFLHNRVKLGTFLKNIEGYLTNGSDESFAECAGKLHGKLAKLYDSRLSSISLNALLGTLKTDFVIEWPDDNEFKEPTMPWLVPSCSLKALEETRGRAPSLFDDLDIAALVPGLPNAPFDASAYSCKKLGQDEPAWEFEDTHPEWVFEFKARAENYSLGTAQVDLKTKCVNLRKNLASEPKNKRARRETDDDKDELECHAMLIAVTGGLQNSCKIYYSDHDYSDHRTPKYLRVALVVGLGRKKLRKKVG